MALVKQQIVDIYGAQNRKTELSSVLNTKDKIRCEKTKQEASPVLLNYESVRQFPRSSVFTWYYRDGSVFPSQRNTICEHELEIFVNEAPLVTLLCSRISLKELAFGFLFSEGLIESMGDVDTFHLDEHSHAVHFRLNVAVPPLSGHTISSGFGGKVLWKNSSALERNIALCQKAFAYTIDDVIDAVSLMRSQAEEYGITRGIHCSALFRQSFLVASYEDIGRHNTFDKLIGHCLLEGHSTDDTLLVTTGRISSEMMRKAQRFGVSGVASLSGPTDRAIAIAQEAGILLVGYAEDASAIVYTGFVVCP